MKYTAINVGPISDTFSMARKPREFWLASYLFSHLMKCLLEAISKKAKVMSPFVLKEESGKVGLFPDRAFFKAVDDIDINLLIDEGLIKFSQDIKLPLKVIYDYFNIMSASIEVNSDRKAIKELNEYLNYLELTKHTRAPETSKKIYSFLMKTYDSPLFEIARNSKAFHVETLDEIASTELKSNNSVVRKSYHNYICIIQADGDNMGNVVTHLPDNTLYSVSQKLMDFGKEACDLITNFGGLPIYAGGDDLLFIAPVRGCQCTSVFTLIDQIDNAYQKVVKIVEELNVKDNENNLVHTSMSYGISMTYDKYPLYEAWKIASEQLFVIAKDKKKHGGQKNAIAWKLQKHSGSTYEGSFSKSEKELYKAFIDLLSIFPNDNLVSAVAHKIRSNESLLALLKDSSPNLLEVRLNAFFDHIIDTMDKTTESLDYIQHVRSLLSLLYKNLSEKKLKDVPNLISCIYGMIRTAKFINGEEEKL